MAESPAAILRLAEAELRRRAQDPHYRPEQRDQYAATADLFGHVAADLAFGGAREVRSGSPATRMVVDSEAHDRPEWLAALAAARAWLVPTPTEVL